MRVRLHRLRVWGEVLERAERECERAESARRWWPRACGERASEGEAASPRVCWEGPRGHWVCVVCRGPTRGRRPSPGRGGAGGRDAELQRGGEAEAARRGRTPRRAMPEPAGRPMDGPTPARMAVACRHGRRLRPKRTEHGARKAEFRRGRSRVSGAARAGSDSGSFVCRGRLRCACDERSGDWNAFRRGRQPEERSGWALSAGTGKGATLPPLKLWGEVTLVVRGAACRRLACRIRRPSQE